MARRDALLEILGPAWIAALGSDMTLTALPFSPLHQPGQVKRLGKARLAAFFRRCSRQAWADERADAVIDAATTLRLWAQTAASSTSTRWPPISPPKPGSR